MKTITQSLAIKLRSRYHLFRQKLKETRSAYKGELGEVYKKILKKLLIESDIEPDNDNVVKYYLGETTRYWNNKNPNIINERRKLLLEEENTLRDDVNWNVYMCSLIKIPTNPNLIESARNLEKIVEDSRTNEPEEDFEILINEFDLALENINNIGGPEVATEDVVSPYEFELAKRIEHEFKINEIEEDSEIHVSKEDSKEFVKLPPVVQKKISWIQMHLF